VDFSAPWAPGSEEAGVHIGAHQAGGAYYQHQDTISMAPILGEVGKL
jgi:hypothetical protein